MDINYYKKYEPIFGSWNIVRMIGEGSFGQVYEIERNELGTTYKAALKTITIPQTQSEINSVKADGMTDDEVTSYYEGVVQDIINEFVLMAQMKGTSHIVSYEDHQIIKHEEGIGWDILIRMELLTPIFEHLKEKEYTAVDVVKMGIDLCKALELCQKHNIVHRDVKPENIFISPNGDYKLGDFGIARTVEKTTSGLSRKGTFLYMAPEVYLGKAYGSTVDIYSLGLVMYRLLNDNRMPFFPEYPKPITHTDRENALIERISGAQLTKPSKAADDLAQIILKACEFDPEKRYHTASEMRKELEMTLKEMEKETTVENSVSISDEFAKALEEEQVKGTDMIEAEAKEEVAEQIEETQVTDEKSDAPDDVVEEKTNETQEDNDAPVSDDESEEGLDSDDMIFNMEETATNEEPVLNENEFEKPILENEETDIEEVAEVEESKTKSKKPLIIIAAIIIVIIGIVIAIIPSSSDEGIQDITGIDSELEMMIGDEFAPEYAIEPSEYSDEEIIFTVNDEDVVVVDENGVITAVGGGEAIITISAGEYSEDVGIVVKEEEDVEDDSDDRNDNNSPTSSKNKDKDKNKDKGTVETQASTEPTTEPPVTEPTPEPTPEPAPEPETPAVEQPAE